MANKIHIGVDPAFRKNGMSVCILSPNEEPYFKTFSSFLAFYGWVAFGDAPKSAIWCVENSNMQDSTFNMKGNKQQIAKTSRNVGKNQAVSQITVWLLQSHFGKDSVLSISPREKGRKLNAAEFKAASGLKIRSNQDERDAWKLARIARYRSRFFKVV